MSTWECQECAQENEADDQVCVACDEPRPKESNPRYQGYKVGSIVETAAIPKTKLTEIKVDIGEAEPVNIVTNAKVKAGMRVVVAIVGSTIMDNGEETVIKKTNVGGRCSAGMLCNGPMLGWVGGDASAPAQVPESFALGDQPPSSRPRLK
uniref:RanBP2-type domain-containing protein n=1 Tax=Eutreptiella gymnastica TaxID=73025 RepID=A0A7S1NGC2_9EUGL|mmetsp:Transcript_313/g.776  ORF Transcript_313/g.776 Transcript_313/m.776 type:complete len:151 (+) Transcript_313:35-487(+)